jgi:hypothetical protein
MLVTQDPDRTLVLTAVPLVRGEPCGVRVNVSGICSSHVYETKPGGLIDLKDMLLDG